MHSLSSHCLISILLCFVFLLPDQVVVSLQSFSVLRSSTSRRLHFNIMSGKGSVAKSIRSFFTSVPVGKKARGEEGTSILSSVTEDLDITSNNNADSTADIVATTTTQTPEKRKKVSVLKVLGSPPMNPMVASATTTTTTCSSIASQSSDDIAWQPFQQMEDNWKHKLIAEYHKPYFQRLLKFLEGEVSKKAVIYPPADQIFTALNLCPYDQVKVVVIGQDPYHGPGQAHGLAFSVQKGVQIPPSLRNMFTEAVNDPKVRITAPTHGNLEAWAKQGVLMLNTVLTVRKNEAFSHQKQGWEQFTEAVIRELSKKEGIVYLLWGKPAQAKCAGIDHKKNIVLTCSHPSPLSAYKTDQPFLGSKIFSRCNEALESLGKTPIDWSVR